MLHEAVATTIQEIVAMVAKMLPDAKDNVMFEKHLSVRGGRIELRYKLDNLESPPLVISHLQPGPDMQSLHGSINGEPPVDLGPGIAGIMKKPEWRDWIIRAMDANPGPVVFDRPDGMVEFDEDTHLALVTEYVAMFEASLFGANTMIGLPNAKKDGVRVHHTIQREDGHQYLAYSPNFIPTDHPLAQKLELVGVKDGELWVKVGGGFMSAKAYLEQQTKQFTQILKRDPVANLLKEIIKSVNKPVEGDEWKDG